MPNHGILLRLATLAEGKPFQILFHLEKMYYIWREFTTMWGTRIFALSILIRLQESHRVLLAPKIDIVHGEWKRKPSYFRGLKK